jgi:biopolymer transport protein ExbD
MAGKVKSLDVWIVEGNVVYKEVPFTVVIDWVQQGRLLEDDQVRPAGSDKWFTIGSSKTLAAYLPKAQPFEIDDQAQALEPVEVDFSWKHRHADEDDDPDMIPLIDISLVLLVFFMMTATVIVSATSIDVPGASNAWLGNATGSFWVGIDRTVDKDGKEGPPQYSFGEGEKAPDKENTELTEAEMLKRLTARLTEENRLVDIRIAADKKLLADVVMNMTAALERVRQERKYIRDIRAEVNEKK